MTLAQVKDNLSHTVGWFPNWLSSVNLSRNLGSRKSLNIWSAVNCWIQAKLPVGFEGSRWQLESLQICHDQVQLWDIPKQTRSDRMIESFDVDDHSHQWWIEFGLFQTRRSKILSWTLISFDSFQSHKIRNESQYSNITEKWVGYLFLMLFFKTTHLYEKIGHMIVLIVIY